MKSQTLHVTSTTTLKEELQSLITQDFKPTLAIVFNSVNANISEIQVVFNDFKIDVIGCTTAGEIADEKLLENSIVALLLDINPDYYQVEMFNYNENTYKAAFNAAQKSATHFDNLGLLVLSGGLAIDAISLVNGLKDGIGYEIPIYGGLAGDDFKLIQTYAFSNHQITEHGAVVLVINTDKIEMKGMARSGWEAIGVEKTITKVEGSVVYEINGERAYDVFIRYFGLTDSIGSFEYLLSLQTNYPLQIIREKDTILRTPFAIDKETGTLTFLSTMSEGDKFKFSNAPGFNVIEQTIEEFQVLKTKTPEVDALILFSCKARHGAFGPLLEDEIEGLYNYWQKPMVGFLSYGEIGNTVNGICEFHNATCSLITLKEK